MFVDKLPMKFSSTVYLSLLFWVGSTAAFAADNADQEQGVKVNGVVFNISKDRKIEKIGGVYNPEGLDKYVDRRLNEMNERLQTIETHIAESNTKLDKLAEQLSAAAAKDSVPPSSSDKPKS